MVHSDYKMMARSPPLQIVVVLLSRILLTRAVDTGGINDGGGSAYGRFLFYYKAKTPKISIISNLNSGLRVWSY